MPDKLFDSSDNVRHANPYAACAIGHAGRRVEAGAGWRIVGRDGGVRDLRPTERGPKTTPCLSATPSAAIRTLPGTMLKTIRLVDIVVGPGKPIDTNRFFVICPNLLGGCRGTTGPGSINPQRETLCRSFPTVTIGDMVEVQRRLLEQLGIRHLLAIIGGSVGGHQALTWATRHPNWACGVIPIATSARLTSQSLAFDVVGRNAILRDPHFHGGQYYDKSHSPDVGLAIARMIGHITYLSREAMTEKSTPTVSSRANVAVQFEKNSPSVRTWAIKARSLSSVSTPTAT